MDASSAPSRAAERHKRIALSGVTSVLGRICTLLVPLITIPLTLSYLGKEQYGIWITLSSITATLNFADLGIGLGLLNLISECNGKDDRLQAHVYVSSAFYALAFISLVLTLSYGLVAPHLHWEILFHDSAAGYGTEITGVMAIFFIAFFVNMPLDIVDRIYAGYQEGYATNIGRLVGSYLYLLGVILAVRYDLGLRGLVAISSGIPIIMVVANGFRLFHYVRPWLLPKLSLVSRGAIARVLKIGSMFLILQICVAVSFNSDNIVISSIDGASAVAEYAVPSKLFGLLGSFVPMFMAGVWPALTEAAHRGDVIWVRRTLTKALQICLVITIPSALALACFAPVLVTFWTHGQLHPSNLIFASLAIWTVIGSVANVASVFMNAMSAIRFQTIAAPLASILNLMLSIWLTQHWGPAGVSLGSSISNVLFLIPVFALVIPGLLAKLNRIGADKNDLE